MFDGQFCEWTLYDTDLTTRLAILPVGRSHLYTEISEPGSGELTIPLNSTSASLVTSGMFCSCKYRGANHGGFFVDNISKDEAGGGEGGDRWLSVSGRGALALLNDAIVWNNSLKKTTRQFQDKTKAEILITLLTEAQTRGGLSALTWDFDATQDSASVAWDDSETFNVNVGTTMLEVVQQMATYAIDFEMNYSGSGFVLSAYKNGIGTDKTNTLFFRIGSNCEEVRSDQRSDELSNALHVNYQKGYIDVTDPASITANRRREALVSMKEAQTKKSATTYGAAKLSTIKDPKLGISVRVFDGIKPNIYLDYILGDTISLDVFGTVYEWRILGLQLDFEGETFANVTLELNDLLYDKNSKMARQLDWLENQWNTANDADLIEVSFWQNIGAVPGSIVRVDSLHVYNNYLYAGCYSSPGNNKFARKNLQTGAWQTLLSGINGNIQCITHVGTDVYFGINNQGANWAVDNSCLYKFDTLTSIVTTVPRLNRDNGAGNDSAICYALDVIGSDLYAAGIFTNADGTAVANIVKWDTVGETYTALGAGVSAFVYALAHIGTDLYIGGSFSGKLKMWDGATYTTISGPNSDVYALANNDGLLIAGGNFTGYLASWDGATWATYAGGVNASVRALVVYLTDVYAIGEFNDVGFYIALYSGGEWWKLDDNGVEGLDDFGYCIALNGDDVFAGGVFLHAGGKPMSRMGAYYTSFNSLLNDLSSESFDLGRAIHEAVEEDLSDNDEFPFWEDTSNDLRKATWGYIKAFFVNATQTAKRVLFSNNAGTVTTKSTFRFHETDDQLSLGDPYFAESGAAGIAQEATGKSVSNFLETYGASFSSFLSFVRGRGTKASPTAIQADDPIGRLRGRAWDGAGTIGNTSIDGFMVASENHSPTAHGTRWDFYTTPNTTTTLTKAFTIDQDGNVNIQTGKTYNINGTPHTHAGGLTGSGTTGQLAKWTSASALGDAAIIPPASNILTLTNAAASTLALNITASKTLTLTAVDNYALTVPATGIAALLGTANVFTTTQIITPATDVVGLTINKSATVNSLEVKNSSLVTAFIGPLGEWKNDYRPTVLSGTVYGNYNKIFYAPSANSTVTIRGLFSEIGIASGNTKNVSVIMGWNSSIAHNGTGTIDRISALETNADNGSTGVITALYGIRVNTMSNASGSIGTLAGIKVENQTATTTVARYAIWTNKGLNLFGDQTSITGWQDVNQLIVTGFTTQTLPVGYLIDNTAATNVIRNVLQLETQSTGTAANGLGAGLLYSLETATASTMQNAAQIAGVWVDATNATRKAKLQLSAYDTAARLGLEIEASGSAVKLGFFGGTTQLKQTGDIIAALGTAGLVTSPIMANGAFYAEDVSQTVSATATHTFYEVGGSMTTGHCSSDFTFQNSKELKCNTAGWYHVKWSMTLLSSVGDNTIEGAVMVNSTGKVDTNNATRAKENGVAYSVSGCGSIQLAVNDVVKLCVEVETVVPSTITVTHANLILSRIE